jgi:hypothetical protein
MTRSWKVGDVVKLFDGAYSTGTIFAEHDGRFDVARPYLYAHEVGGFTTGVEVVRGLDPARLVAAEVDVHGDPRRLLHGCYTYEDLKKVASGEWKL